MTVHLDSEVVATRFDDVTQTCFYTIQRDDKQWTVAIPAAELNKHGPNKVTRRNMIATALNNAMAGAPDPNPTLRL